MTRTQRRRSSWVAGGLVVLGVGAAGYYGVTRLQHALDFDPDRRHLEEIAIPPTACPPVESIHHEAGQFQFAFTTAAVGFDTELEMPPWPELQAQVDQAAVSFDGSIERGLPTFPRPLRRQLRAVRDSLAKGRDRLATVTEQEQFDDATRDLFEAGQEHFGYASDLVGDQCAVPLRAESAFSILERRTATTTTAQPPPQLPPTGR